MPWFSFPAERLMESILLLIGCSLYFLPSFVAFKRDLPRKNDLMILNLVFGWTGIGWLIVMFLCCFED